MEGGIPQGTQIGSYVIDSPIGRGGMGVVYRAYHPRLQRWAAIKMLPPFADSGDARERFEREARAIARLRHRHILTVFDFGEFAGQPYMALEYMSNGSLQERMPSQSVSVEQALTLLRPLAEALDYAHAQGVLHRDVKPANVFLDSELQPVLADFGLAKLYSEESLSSTGLVFGTPTHMSPEQANGKPPSGATDQYALAVIAFQLLTGRLPFVGALMELLYAHVNTPPPAASSFNSALAPRVDAVLARGLSKEPADRFPSCLALASALEAAAAGRVDERRLPPARVTAVAEPAAETIAMAPAAAERPRRRRGMLAGVLAAVAVLAAAGVYATGALGVSWPGAASPGGAAGGSEATTTTPVASPSSTRRVSVSPAPPLALNSTITVSGTGFDPRFAARAGFIQGADVRLVHPISQVDMPVAPDGSFSGQGIVPGDLHAGPATLVVCGTDPRQQNDLRTCAQVPVTLR